MYAWRSLLYLCTSPLFKRLVGKNRLPLLLNSPQHVHWLVGLCNPEIRLTISHRWVYDRKQQVRNLICQWQPCLTHRFCNCKRVANNTREGSNVQGHTLQCQSQHAVRHIIALQATTSQELMQNQCTAQQIHDISINCLPRKCACWQELLSMSRTQKRHERFTFQHFLAPHKFFQSQWFSCWSKLTCPKRHYLAVLLISSRLMCHESFQEKLPTSTNQEMAWPQAHACMLCAKILRCCCPKKNLRATPIRWKLFPNNSHCTLRRPHSTLHFILTHFSWAPLISFHVFPYVS